MTKRADPRFDVVCNKSQACTRHRQEVARTGRGCGGATPHYHVGCDKCSVDDTAFCVPVCLICRERPSVVNGECADCSADH